MQVADRAIEVLEGVASDPDSERVKTHGQKTTKFLFHLGADHLKKSVIIIHHHHYYYDYFYYCLFLPLSLPPSLPLSLPLSSNISGAATVAECLILLSKSNEWKSTVAMMIGGVLDVPPDSIALSEIFGLLVIAGFPKVRYAT